MLSFLLLFVLTTVSAAYCPAPTPSSATLPCNMSTVIMVDVSSDASTPSAISRSQIFSFISSDLLPRLYYKSGQEVGVITYGATETSEPLTKNYTVACEETDVAKQDADQNGGKNTTLAQALRNFFQDYDERVKSVILFSNSQNVIDIREANAVIAKYNDSTHFTVVALSGHVEVWWWNFDAYVTLSAIPGLSDQPSDFGDCLVGRTCQQTSSICTQFEYAPTTTNVATTTTAITTMSPRTTPYPETINGPRCVCQPSTAWLDIMLLFDASSYNGRDGLFDLLDYSTLFDDLTLKKSSSDVQQSTRIGIITYADNASLIYPLGSIDSISGITSLPYSGKNGTNIADAILLAMTQFKTNASRPNARKMIVLLSAGYFAGKYDDPHTAAYQFKNTSGVLAVYNDLGTRTPRDKSQTLEEIASRDYYYTNIQDDGNTMINYVCDANCFCAPDTISFLNADAGYPTAGCYTAHENAVNEAIAVRGCVRDEAVVAMEKTKEKGEFIAKSMPANKKFWIGITRDPVRKAWVWSDGTVVSGSYQPWMTNSDYTSPNECVYGISIGGEVKWQQYDCRKKVEAYACESRACDSANYCDISHF